MTRKLRRRPNDPIPEKVERKRKPTPVQFNYLADDKEIESDLKAISRGKAIPIVCKPGICKALTFFDLIRHYRRLKCF